MRKKAVVLLSGGIDSSVCLAIAAQNFTCYALSIDYKQRNRYELDCAKVIAQRMGVAEHRIIRCELPGWEGSALLDNRVAVDHYATPQVNTYVPARNSIFLTMALGWAETLSCSDIFFAANADDNVNYPDCRPEFFTAFSVAANLAARNFNGERLQIHLPLIDWQKAQIVQEGRRLNLDFSLTFSCYDPIQYTQACGQCLACHLRIEALDQLVLS